MDEEEDVSTFFQDWLDTLEEGGTHVTVVDLEDFPDNNEGGGDGGQLITLD